MSDVEVAAVIDGRRDPVLSSPLDRLISMAKIELVPLSVCQAQLAANATDGG